MFAAQVTRSLALSGHYPLSIWLLQKAKALKLYKYTELSVAAYLPAPVYGARPTSHKLGSPEALEEQAAAEVAASMEELKRKAAGFGLFSGGSKAAAAIACAEAARPRAAPCAARTSRGGNSTSWSAAARRSCGLGRMGAPVQAAVWCV